MNTDKSIILETIEQVPMQIRQAWEEVSELEIPRDYYECENIVFAGMGGSLLGYYANKSMFGATLKIPMQECNGYFLPEYVSEKTLFFANSFSGTTEETLYTLKLAHKKGAKIFGQTTGGEMADYLRQNNLPCYIYDPKYNPSAQPRQGYGYSIFAPMALFAKLGYIQISTSVVSNALEFMKDTLSPLKDTISSQIKKFENFPIVYTASEHLEGVAHISRNLTHETAKHFACEHFIPELNHHLMEGLSYPKNNKLYFQIFNSNFYHPRVLERVSITAKVIADQGHIVEIVNSNGANKLEEFLYFLSYGAYIAYFLGMHHGIDPSKIPFVDFFKEKLGKIQE